MNPVVIIPCTGEPVAIETVKAALTQSPRVIVVGKIPAGLPGDERLTVIDAGQAVPPGRARNLGVAAAPDADVLVFLDADCVPQEGWLSKLLHKIEKGHELVGGVLKPEGKGYCFLADQVTSFFDQLEGTKSGAVETLTATNLTVTRSLWVRAGPFPEYVPASEDIEFVLSCRRAGAIPFLEGAACVAHRPSPTDFRRLIAHASLWGAHSIGVRRRFADVLSLPFFLRSRLLLFFLAPLIGMAFAFYQLLHTPRPWRKFRLWPAMAIAKIVWCLSAAKSKR